MARYTIDHLDASTYGFTRLRQVGNHARIVNRNVGPIAGWRRSPGPEAGLLPGPLQRSPRARWHPSGHPPSLHHTEGD